MASERRRSFVMCLTSDGYAASLIVRRIYERLPDAGVEQRGLVRVIDESGEDYAYPARLFVAVDLPDEAEKAFG